MRKTVIFGLSTALLLALVSLPAAAQQSPKGKANTQTGAGFSKSVEVSYSRPILRGRRDIFGEGESYGQKVNAGAPVWRAGADVSTRLKTDVGLEFGGTAVPAGEYSLFVELNGADDWQLIVSNHEAQQNYDPNNKEALWGAYGYNQEQDVARAAMTVQPPIGFSMDELTWYFTDVTETGFVLNLIWEQTTAAAAFTVAE